MKSQDGSHLGVMERKDWIIRARITLDHHPNRRAVSWEQRAGLGPEQFLPQQSLQNMLMATAPSTDHMHPIHVQNPYHSISVTSY